MNTDYRPTNSWDFRLRAAKVGELVSMRSLAALSLMVALIALLATLAALSAPPLQAQSLTTFVGNTSGSGTADSDNFQAQSFETGANEGGYTVSQVYILLDDASGKSTSVSIKEDNGGVPGELVTTLANPGDIGVLQIEHVHGTGRHHSGCEHDLLANLERGNLIQPGAICVDRFR